MKQNDEHRYDDIIDLQHHVSRKHPQMSLLDRAAQFAPFAALAGHESSILEMARLTEEKVEPDESSKELFDIRLQCLQEHSAERPEVIVTYFRPDEKKSGGAYVTVTGVVKRVDAYARELVFTDGRSIPMDAVIGIEGEMFDRI